VARSVTRREIEGNRDANKKCCSHFDIIEARAALGIRKKKRRLDDRPAGDQTIDNDDNRDDKQQVNQAAAHMHHEESKNPKDEQDYRDRPKHDGIPARSELHPARQTVSSAWRAATRPGVMVPHAQHDGNLYACNVREAGGERREAARFAYSRPYSPTSSRLSRLQNICAKQVALRRSIIMNASTCIDSAEGREAMLVGARVHYVENRNSFRDRSI